ncbi:hypothetical protein [Polaromonas sp.]|uniref:hypothetical protein n=1 Tax=Polaromonas sp. TaxID=1869339 RepID=UPI003BA9969E
MNFKPMMRQLLKGPVVPRMTIKKEWHDKGGIYAIWGNAELRPLLCAKEVTLHTSKQNNHEVVLKYCDAVERSLTRLDEDGSELFCFYVGKTAHLKKRMSIQRYKRMHELLGQEKCSDLKAMLRISFSRMDDWQGRFFAEGYAIALLLPVTNVQPER